MPKSEINPNAEIRTGAAREGLAVFQVTDFAFQATFGFRPSDFGF
jgi:hypothetical protein